MASTIDRVHFEERQYLRSFDWEAEQLYHIEMRRRLNLALHLWGIVDGLDLRTSVGQLGLPATFHVSRGMAIDAYGREIVVPLDYALTEADLERSRIQTVGTFDLAVVYTRELTTPPGPGYRLCDVKDQYTRWRESFAILISPKASALQPSQAPGVADPLSDDPAQDSWPVVLGEITTARPLPAGRLIIDSVKAVNRTYAGLRAQQIVTPAASVSSDEGEAARPLVVDANVLANQNMFVGADFVVPNDPTKATPPETGVLKVNNDLFLNGEFYAFINGDWLTMKEYLQSFVPDVQVGQRVVITNRAQVNGVITDTEEIELTTRLKDPQGQTMSVALNSIEWLSQDQFASWEPATPGSSPVKLLLNEPIAQKMGPSKFKFPITWSVEPVTETGTPIRPIGRFVFSYTAVFNP